MSGVSVWRNIWKGSFNRQPWRRGCKRERSKKGKKMRKKRKQFWCVALTMMALLSGCGLQGVKDVQRDEKSEEPTMGRYVEEETDLSAQVENAAGIYRSSDGKLTIIGRQGEILVSEDNGNTWENCDRKWIQDIAANSYIMDVKIDSRGTAGIIYAETGEEGNGPAETGLEMDLQCVLLLPDETVISVEFPKTGNEETIDRFWISPADRYFVSTTTGNIYEVNADGSSRLYLTTEGSPQMIQFLGNLMMIDGYGFNEPLLYDMERERYTEDEVLAEFVRGNYQDRGFNGSGWQNLCLFPGEDDVIFLAGKNGLHRHVIGGAAMEQIIDGRLSRLGNPQYGIVGMIFLENGSFLAVSDQSKLLRFTYDPKRETVPPEKLKVYSLKKNSDMYMAVSLYQIQNPDVFVEYEVGMEENGAVTEADALKKLNVQIMAGEGPDILLLDGLPMDSYIEKGMLCDLKNITEDLRGEVFDNLLGVFAQEDKIYAVPGQVRFPVMMGKESDISAMKGLSSVADGMERLRREEPGKDLIGLCSEKAVMKFFAVTSAQGWKKTDAKIDRDAMEEFLTQTKRIYEAQMDGINMENRERLRQSEESNVQNLGDEWMYDLANYGYFMDYAAGGSQMFLGISGSPDSYMELSSISRAKGFEDTIVESMEGEAGLVFIPDTVLGINAAASQKELAEDFLRMFLGKENQCNLSGYAVNREAFANAFAHREEETGENGECRKFGVMYEDGRAVMLDIFWPSNQEIDKVKKWMETAKKPYMEDAVFERCVFEEGSQFILDRRGMQETLDAIERRIGIYLAE